MVLGILTRIFCFFVTLVVSEVIEITRNNPNNAAMGDFEFTVMNYIDNSRASRESIKIFEAAERIFAETSKRAEKVGWGQMNVEKYPELAKIPEGMNLPA